MPIDISDTCLPKSDQLNADDFLLTGPITITVTGVKRAAADQPVVVSFEHDGGKPYKPCKQMRVVLRDVWGKDAATWVGRSMTLFRDPNVTFGGLKVGGIRISHMSHITSDAVAIINATKGNKKAYTVKPLAMTAPDALTNRARALYREVTKADPTAASHAALKVKADALASELAAANQSEISQKISDALEALAARIPAESA